MPKNRIVEKEKRQKDKKERIECTFFPKTNSKPLSRQASPRELSKLGMKKTEHLYKLTKPNCTKKVFFLI